MSNIDSDTSYRGDEYLLRLTAGLGWRLIATDKAKPWLDKMAGIMRLRRCNSAAYPEIIFCRNEFGKETLKNLIVHPQQEATDGNGVFDDWSIMAKFEAVFDLWVHERRPDMIFDLGRNKARGLEFLRMSEAVSAIFVHACLKGGIPFHATLVEYRGKGMLLAAPSGVGKSTCARRIPAPWRALCDDAAIVIKNGQGRYLVHPFPTWSEYVWEKSTSTWDVEHRLPLSSVFFLEQAEKDQVIPLRKAKAVVYMVRSAGESLYSITDNYSPEEKKHIQGSVFENACELAKNVPAYILQVSLEGQFWKKMEEVLGETGLAEAL